MLLPETLKQHDKNRFSFHFIYFLPWKNQMEKSLVENGGTVTCLNARNNIFLMLRLRAVVKYVKDNDIKIIHAHLPWAGILARMVGRLVNIPVIYTEHNILERYHLITRIANLATMNWLTKLIAVSEEVALSVQRNKSSLVPPVQVLVNGVDTNHFQPNKSFEIRRLLGIPDNASVVGTVAVFRPQKRLDVWIDTAKTIADIIPDVHFVIVGDGPLKSSLLEKRAILSMAERIHFVGLQTDIRPFLAAFDLYLISSKFEGLPVALLEAMASGCAVVSTDAGGIKEVIRHNIDGLMCPVDEADLLVPYAVDLLRSAEKRVTIGRHARQRIIESFSLTKMVSELESVYANLLDETELGRGLGAR